MAGNPDFDAILSTTLANYRNQLEDNIFSNLPLTYWLRDAGNIVKLSGGESIVEQLLYGQNGTAGSYSGYDNLDTTPQEGITAAQYPWRQYAASVAISGLEERKNSGSEKLIDLLKAKVNQAELSIQETMNAMFTSDGSGNGGKDWFGLDYFVPVDPTSGTVGGIDAAAETWWRSKADATAKVLELGDLNHMYNLTSKGKIHPVFELTTMDLYEKYESLLQPQVRYQNTKVADAGFQNLMHKGATVQYDDDIASGRWYFLNPRFLKLKVHSAAWFKNTPFETPHGQDARYSQILCMGNMTANNRRFLGVLSGKTV